MVIDQPTDIDLPVQVLILFRPIKLELVRFDDLHFESVAILATLDDQRWRSYLPLSLHGAGAGF